MCARLEPVWVREVEGYSFKTSASQGQVFSSVDVGISSPFHLSMMVNTASSSESFAHCLCQTIECQSIIDLLYKIGKIYVHPVVEEHGYMQLMNLAPAHLFK